MSVMIFERKQETEEGSRQVAAAPGIISACSLITGWSDFYMRQICLFRETVLMDRR
jgi:hypothetical protein